MNQTDIFKNFLKASDEAKRLMLESDDIWEKVRPYVNAEMINYLLILEIFIEKAFLEVNSQITN